MRNMFKRVERCGSWIWLCSRSCGVGFLTALWVGLLLAEAGHFSAWIALLTAVVAGGLVWRYFRRRRAELAVPEVRPLGLLVAGALALSSLAFTIPPSEFLLVGWDPGVYVHTASVLANKGTLSPEFPDLATMDADSWKGPSAGATCSHSAEQGGRGVAGAIHVYQPHVSLSPYPDNSRRTQHPAITGQAGF